MNAKQVGASEGILRKAKSEDIPAILRLVKENRDRILPRSDVDIREMLDYFWVIDEGGEVVGCCCLEIYSHKICEIRTLIVKAGHLGRGYGRMLVDAAVGEAKRRKIPQILAISSNREFFEKVNFGPCLNERFALFWNGAKGD